MQNYLGYRRAQCNMLLWVHMDLYMKHSLAINIYWQTLNDVGQLFTSKV